MKPGWCMVEQKSYSMDDVSRCVYIYISLARNLLKSCKYYGIYWVGGVPHQSWVETKPVVKKSREKLKRQTARRPVHAKQGHPTCSKSPRTTSNGHRRCKAPGFGRLRLLVSSKQCPHAPEEQSGGEAKCERSKKHTRPKESKWKQRRSCKSVCLV